MYVYRVKDPDGKYCYWNPTDGRFETIKSGPEGSYPYGTTNFNNLSSVNTVDEHGNTVYSDQTLASFDSSTYGTITEIPPYYTVEVLDLVPGLWYKVIERPTEIPYGCLWLLLPRELHRRCDGNSAAPAPSPFC